MMTEKQITEMAHDLSAQTAWSVERATHAVVLAAGFVEVVQAARAVLDNFTPFITAWEANEPMAGPDGEDLYARLRAAVQAVESP